MQVVIDVKPRPASEPGALDAFMLDCSACGPKLDLGSSIESMANKLADEHQRWHASPAAVPIAERVRGYRDRIAADPDLYDGDVDVVYWLVADTPYRSWSPSEVGRAVGIETHAARSLLCQLRDGGHVRSDGNGSRTRYLVAR